MAGEGAVTEDPIDRATELCIQSQSMIDITADKLFALRKQLKYKATEDLIQNEIKESESKIIKMISRQLVAKANIVSETIPDRLQLYPKTAEWFRIVGIDAKVADGLGNDEVSLQSLLKMSSSQVEKLLENYSASREDIDKLNAALTNLKMWTASQMDSPGSMSDRDLHWSNYKRPSTSSLPPDLPPQSPPATPPSTPTPLVKPPPPPPPPQPQPPPPPQQQQQTKKQFHATPPPKRRNKLYPDVFHPLSKSKSYESKLSIKVNQETNVDISRYIKKKPDNLTITGASSFDALLNQQRKRSAGDVAAAAAAASLSGQLSPLFLSSSSSSPPHYHDAASLSSSNTSPAQQELYDVHPNKKNQLAVPVSPNTPLIGQNRSMGHSIKHGFQTKLVFGACDFCHKHVLRQGKVCKFCKRKFHRDCASKAAPTCGLPEEYLDAFIEACVQQGSPGPGRHGSGALSSGHQAPDSSSTTSSCTSSNPSSPALFYNTTPSSSTSAQPSPHIHITDHTTQFHFPESCTSSITDSLPSVTDTIATVYSIDSQTLEKSDIVNTNTSNDSDKSDRTLIDGPGSGGQPAVERTDSVDSSGEDVSSSHWHRAHSDYSQRPESTWSDRISVVLKEWDIPFEELALLESIGTGHFGVVYKGNWHGDVAIKMLNMEKNTDIQLSAFKLEVAQLRKTRHENLVLFMGACMSPPHLAIITSLCKGRTLYNSLHLREEKMQMNRTIIIASQIAQGMGYLHAKNIVHKDLKSKNVFLETGKVVITDYGIFNVTKLCQDNRKKNCLNIPLGWLCYLAPEIMRSLHTGHNMDLPFSKGSDVYAFGTVWYELLSGEWPFRHQPPEVIIWQVGKGIKQVTGTNLNASKDVKELLMMCWTSKPSSRPDFSNVLKYLDRLPKKRLARSPSHPVQLSRSAESIF